MAAERLVSRRKAAEARIDLKRRLIAHALYQTGLKKLRVPTSTLSVTESAIKAIPVAPDEIPSCWWRPQPPKLDQDALTKAVRAREQALASAQLINDAEARAAAMARAEELHPPIPGVSPSEPGITLIRRV